MFFQMILIIFFKRFLRFKIFLQTIWSFSLNDFHDFNPVVQMMEPEVTPEVSSWESIAGCNFNWQNSKWMKSNKTKKPFYDFYFLIYVESIIQLFVKKI